MPYRVKLRAAHKECQDILDKHGVEWKESSTRKLIISDEELEYLRENRREGIKDPWQYLTEEEVAAEREPEPEKTVEPEPTEPEPVVEAPPEPEPEPELEPEPEPEPTDLVGEETIVEEDNLDELRERAKAAGIRGPIGAMRAETLREKLADLE